MFRSPASSVKMTRSLKLCLRSICITGTRPSSLALARLRVGLVKQRPAYFILPLRPSFALFRSLSVGLFLHLSVYLYISISLCLYLFSLFRWRTCHRLLKYSVHCHSCAVSAHCPPSLSPVARSLLSRRTCKGRSQASTLFRSPYLPLFNLCYSLSHSLHLASYVALIPAWQYPLSLSLDRSLISLEIRDLLSTSTLSTHTRTHARARAHTHTHTHTHTDRVTDGRAVCVARLFRLLGHTLQYWSLILTTTISALAPQTLAPPPRAPYPSLQRDGRAVGWNNDQRLSRSSLCHSSPSPSVPASPCFLFRTGTCRKRKERRFLFCGRERRLLIRTGTRLLEERRCKSTCSYGTASESTCVPPCPSCFRRHKHQPCPLPQCYSLQRDHSIEPNA